MLEIFLNDILRYPGIIDATFRFIRLIEIAVQPNKAQIRKNRMKKQ
jgi:hypothetical protein